MPWLTNKEDLDTEDLYLQRLYATKIETLYKKICQSSIESTLPHKVTSYTPVIIPSVKEVFYLINFIPCHRWLFLF